MTDDQKAFTMGRVIWEARIRAAWHPASAELRLRENPWPAHIGADRAASHDLAIASAKGLLAAYPLLKGIEF